MTRNTVSLLLLSLVVAVGCVQSPAGAKSGDVEGAIANEALADSDTPADGYTRRVAIQGSIGFGESVDGHYASGGYAGWVFTATAGARLSIDAMASDGTDTVIALYGPQTSSSWTGARPLATNDDYHGSTNSHIDHRVTRAGTYLVIVREYWNDAGNFTLTLACAGTECRQECGTACPTGSECHRVECIRAPCPSYCAPIAVHHEGDACDPSLCGIAPRIVTLMCDDGSTGGFTGNCLYDADATTCHWEIRSCPPASCPPNTLLCVRGYHYDGTPGVCACVPDAVGCGARLGDTCAADQFCSFTASAMCGRADATGTCTTRPEICNDLYQPVCGCDGVTYSNACRANGAGTSVLHTGPC
jgi:hypothetical protein